MSSDKLIQEGLKKGELPIIRLVGNLSPILDPLKDLAGLDSTEQNVEKGDPAQLSPGGIDFNPEVMNLKEQGEKIDFNLPDFDLQGIDASQIRGILPVIINITPITNFPLLLGMAVDGEDVEGIGYDFELDPMDRRSQLYADELG